MDKEYYSNYPDEQNFSVTSADLSDDCLNSHMTSPTHTYRKHGHMQSFPNPMPYNRDMGGSNGTFTQEQLKQYLYSLSDYLKKNQPDMINMFQQYISGEYEDMGRQTPLMFSSGHILVRLEFPGLKYQVIPNTLKNEGGIINISDYIYPKSSDIHSDDYPGPLTVEKTTEDQIYSYLEDQISTEQQYTSPIDCRSGVLLMNYLELMIKESGKPKIVSIVRLLNDGVETKTVNLKKENKILDSISRNSFSRASSRATSRASSRPSSPTNMDNFDPDLPQNTLDMPQGPGSVVSMVRRALTNVTAEDNHCQNMDRYRQYLVTGRFEEAVNFASKAGIWDHAFALALRMNNAKLTNEVLVAFSRRAIYNNDPIFTMHELLAQRPPKITATNRAFSNNEQINDWRCHLAMILAVKKFRPEECRQAIESMGEKLSVLRNYYGAHLCYLLAGTHFGLDRTSPRYRRKFDLIGWQSSTNSIPAQKSTYANCHKMFSGLDYWRSAPDHCIKLTEIYEYALKLAGDNSHMLLSVHLIPYKYLMVYKMLANQQVKSAYEYCQSIGEILGYKVNWTECESINFRMIANIRELSYRLNSWLITNDDSGNIASNNLWLSNIDDVYGLFCNKYQLWNPSNTKPDFSRPSELYNQINYTNGGDVVDTDVHGYREAVPEYDQYQSNQYVNRPMYENQSDTHVNYQPSNDPRQHAMRNNISMAESRPLKVTPAPQSLQSQYKPADYIEFNSSRSIIHQSQIDTLSPDYAPRLSLTQPLENSAFRNIAPPSELPNSAILTRPPQFADMRHTTSSSVNNGPYDTHKPKTEIQHPHDLSRSGINKSLSSRFTNEESPSRFMPSTLGQLSHPTINNESHAPNDSPLVTHREQDTKFNQYASAQKTVSAQDAKKSTFVPDKYEDDDVVPDCFASSYQSRSRSQSNGSVGSADNHYISSKSSTNYPPALSSRSRNSSESKDALATPPYHNVTAVSPRMLETTKEENDNSVSATPSTDEHNSKPKHEPSSDSTPSKTGWFGVLFKGRKEIHLPKDDDKPLEYDEKKKRWVNKKNPEEDKPLTPPPMLPSLSENMSSFNSPPSDQAVGSANQFMKSRYRQANFNVKPSGPTSFSPPSNPTFNLPPSFGGLINAPAPSSSPPDTVPKEHHVHYSSDATANFTNNSSEYASHSQYYYNDHTSSGAHHPNPQHMRSNLSRNL